MILIDEIPNIKFYKGIDFNMLKEHPKDGSNGMLVVFVEDYISDVKSYNRNSKINSILENKIHTDISNLDIENNYIAIYQCYNMFDSVYKVVRDKFERNENDAHKIIWKK